MVNDTISDILTRIRNANLIQSQTVSIPLTRISKQIVEILEKQGFIESFQIFPLPLTSVASVASVDSVALQRKGQRKKQRTGQRTGQGKGEGKEENNKAEMRIFSGGIMVYLKYRGREKKPCITNLKRISKPGLRIYANHKEIPKVLGGMGIAILSTSQGIMTDREARFHGIGGEILCSIW